MRGLGIDLADQPGVVLDVEPRPKKSPRAFCAPVRVPDEVYLVLAPIGGRDDFAVLFHEAGHTEHYAHVDRALPFEFRHLGDNAITEAFAFLFQHLVEDPEWLARRLGHRGREATTGLRPRTPARVPAPLRREARVRARAARAGRRVARPGSRGGTRSCSATRCGDRWPSETYLADVDPGFYCACYLRAWALETHLRQYLRERFGPAWFDSAQAGEELRALWREGQRLDPEELLAELTGERLEFGVLVADLGL